MKVSHALIPLRKSILVYLLPFLLLEFCHYSVWAILKLKYEKFLIQGQDSLLFISSCHKHFDVTNSYLWIRNPRLKWYGIEPLDEIEAKKLRDIYGEDCQCEFDIVYDFQCDCGWNQKVTLKEHNAFQEFRIVSKLRITE